MDSLYSTIISYWTPPAPTLQVEPFPSLPTELILLILSHSLPPPSYSPHRTRRLLHLSDSLSCSSDYAGWAQRELRHHVTLPSLTAASRLLRAAQEGRWEGRVVSLRLGRVVEDERGGPKEWWGGNGDVVRELLRVLGGVKELYITGMSGLDLGHFEFGKNLRTLYLSETRLTLSYPPSTSSLHLPNLLHLHLKSTIFAGPHSLSSLLSRAALPSLHTLDYLSVHQSLLGTGTGGRGIPPSLNPPQTGLGALTNSLLASAPHHPSAEFEELAPQIRHLALGNYPTKTLSPREVALCTGLLTLDVPISMAGDFGSHYSDPSAESTLPTTLRALRYRRPTPSPNPNPSQADEEELRLTAEREGLRLLRQGGGSSAEPEEVRRKVLSLPPLSSSDTASSEGGGGDDGGILIRMDQGPWNDQGSSEEDDETRDGPFDLGLEAWRREVRRLLLQDK